MTSAANGHLATTPSGRQRDGGLVAVWFVGYTFIALLVAAVVLAAGVVFAARAHGADLAQQAARAGAQQIDLATYRSSGVLRLDPARATIAAQQHLAAAGAIGSVAVTGVRITVVATSVQPTPMLEPFGRKAISVTATATATPAIGPPP